MPKRTVPLKAATNATTVSAAATPLRRSQRLLHLTPRRPGTAPNLKPKSNTRAPSHETPEPLERNVVYALTASGSSKCSISSTEVKVVSGLRRSPRLSLISTNKESVKKMVQNRSNKRVASKSKLIVKSTSRRSKVSKSTDESTNDKRVSKSKVEGETGAGYFKETVETGGRRRTRSCIRVEGFKLEVGNGSVRECSRKDGHAGNCRRGEKVRVDRKRKREDERSEGCIRGWTREQEMALQRAYFLAKPTPHFWKKVSKLVPGKSAQDCYDKIHSDHMTPPQPMPRSRVKRTNSSPLGCSSLSASRVLNVPGIKINKLCNNRQKGHLAQKTVRQLLQKHNCMDQDYEADLFSVLEPNTNHSTEDAQMNVGLSTPGHLERKRGFLQKCWERSSSSCKKPLSRFGNSNVVPLFSPPVLKQVKNRALHEKYVDQLHSREAKRKAAYARSRRSVAGKEKREQLNVQKVDVRTAKDALICDAIDAVNQLQQHLQASAQNDSLEFDADSIDYEDIDSGI